MLGCARRPGCPSRSRTDDPQRLPTHSSATGHVFYPSRQRLPGSLGDWGSEVRILSLRPKLLQGRNGPSLNLVSGVHGGCKIGAEPQPGAPSLPAQLRALKIDGWRTTRSRCSLINKLRIISRPSVHHSNGGDGRCHRADGDLLRNGCKNFLRPTNCATAESRLRI